MTIRITNNNYSHQVLLSDGGKICSHRGKLNRQNLHIQQSL